MTLRWQEALVGLGLSVLLLSGCDSGPSGAALAPVEFDAHTSCELDGMLLADYGGPKGQIFFAGQEQPQFFCDTVELLNTLLRPEQVRTVNAAFVQDMGQADWDKPRGHWIAAKSAFYVVGGKRHGSMGPTIASFAQTEAAQAFAKQWGGKVLPFAEVTPDMVDLSGGALHDSKM